MEHTTTVPRATKAYRLYRDELTRFLAEAQSMLEAERLNPQHADLLRRNFHKLKGSSGFFGFPEIAQTSAQLEQILLESQTQISRQLGQIKQMILDLDALAQSLPEAQK